jgi:endonuclease YncB( thermonuclease family)
MRLFRNPFVIAALAAATAWITMDERFGRPDRPEAPVEINWLLRTYRDSLKGNFALCDGPIRTNCVVDGDTFWFRGDKIRIADINAPEISEPDCPGEKEAGELARDRLLEMLNDGAFSLASGGRDEDRYGRKLRTVWRSGESLGEQLVQEGLARRWGGPEIHWCGDDK